MRIVLSIVAVGLVFLGLWLIASSSPEPKPELASPTQVIGAPRQTNASPVVLGTALLAGGVIFFVLILRRK